VRKNSHEGTDTKVKKSRIVFVSSWQISIRQMSRAAEVVQTFRFAVITAL